jgi:Nif-specific regulatory protein
MRTDTADNVVEPGMVAPHPRHMEVLATISGILASQSGQEQMLAAVLREMEKALGMVRGTVMLLSPDGSELLVGAAPGIPSADFERLRYRRGEGIIGSVVQTGMPAIVPQVSEEPRFTNRIHKRLGAEEVSFLCVPIVLGSEVVGTLSVDILSEQTEQLHEHCRFLEIVASMITYDVKARRAEATQRQSWEAETLRLRNALEERFRPENIIGNSHSMREVYVKIHQVAGCDITVLIRGESGTGKELVASAVHYTSPRAKKPFVKVNCAALNENLLESELFGHEKGAFTGALCARTGRLEEAEGGTLFLDEIGDLSLTAQAKILRVLQERVVERVGGRAPTPVDVRLLAATNKDLEAEIAKGAFREDLYYRIKVVHIHMPPLRDIREEIPLLATHFLKEYGKESGRAGLEFSPAVMRKLTTSPWPGNVRQLRNEVMRLAACARESFIGEDDLWEGIPTAAYDQPRPRTAKAQSLKTAVEDLEKQMIAEALKETRNNQLQAARTLGLSRQGLINKMKRYSFAE